MTDHAVVVAGGGPTGLMLAAELKLAGIDVAIVERRATQELEGARAGAGGLHARTLEVLDMRGVAERFISQGQKYPVVGFHVPLDISDFPTRHNYVLALWQKHIERILAAWVLDELKVTVYRQREVTGFTQDDTGVTVQISDGRQMRAQFLAGCDGGRSVVRKTAGIDFPGSEATQSWLIAEAQWTREPEWGFRHDARGTHAIGRKEDGRAGIVLSEGEPALKGEPTLQDLREALTRIYGTDFGVHSPNWISRFTDMTRQAAAYRAGRVLLAGDAAHVHPPMGGQGLNTGVQDAFNLGWKLAQVVKGASPASLLDTYHDERHPAGARVIRNTMAASALRRPDKNSKALGEYLAGFLKMAEPRKRMAGEISGLDIHYDLGEGHPLLGRRMPDLDIVTASGPRRVFSLLHKAEPVLLRFGEGGNARYEGKWELPVVGEAPAPAAVLIRPDGHVAWVGDGSDKGLREAQARWFGRPSLVTPL